MLPNMRYACNSCGIRGLMLCVTAVKIRITSLRSSVSSSLMRLLASTTSVGSINTVRPVADSSCTIPFILRFMPGAIGMTNLPSRKVGATSWSTSPSLCAVRKMLLSVRETLPSARFNSMRICAKADVALSRICPNLSKIWSIRCRICGNNVTFSVSFDKTG